MKTNDIKKGTRVQLRNGWYGTMMDNMKGLTRVVNVEGFETEIGSVYSHDIAAALVTFKGTNVEASFETWFRIEHTPAQLKLRRQVEAMGM